MTEADGGKPDGTTKIISNKTSFVAKQYNHIHNHIIICTASYDE
jgi:hypothetical protein